MQTSYSLNPAIAREGMIADSRTLKHIVSRLCEGAVKAGRAVFRVVGGGQAFTSRLDPGTVWQQPSPSQDADVDAFKTNVASSASLQTISGTGWNGVVGTAKMYPERLVTLVLSNHADWDATNATLRGYLNGVLQSETLAIPNGGNATVTSTKRYDQILDLAIPAQSGTGGTATVGVAALDASVTLADFEGFAIYDPALVPNVVPSQDQTNEYHDKDTASILYKGALWVITEDAVSTGGTVHVRISGSGNVGAVRSDTDGGAAIAITGARFGSDASAAGLVKVELY